MWVLKRKDLLKFEHKNDNLDSLTHLLFFSVSRPNAISLLKICHMVIGSGHTKNKYTPHPHGSGLGR